MRAKITFEIDLFGLSTFCGCSSTSRQNIFDFFLDRLISVSQEKLMEDMMNFHKLLVSKLLVSQEEETRKEAILNLDKENVELARRLVNSINIEIIEE